MRHLAKNIHAYSFILGLLLTTGWFAASEHQRARANELTKNAKPSKPFTWAKKDLCSGGKYVPVSCCACEIDGWFRILLTNCQPLSPAYNLCTARWHCNDTGCRRQAQCTVLRNSPPGQPPLIVDCDQSFLMFCDNTCEMPVPNNCDWYGDW